MANLGFEPSKSDPCLFIHKTEKIMVLNYCDDQIWLSPNNDLIERYVNKLKGLGYNLEIEDKGDNIFGSTFLDSWALKSSACPTDKFISHKRA